MPRPLPPLTRRERDIANALLEGRSNKAIAIALGLSEQSVKNRLTALYRKAGVRNRLELAVQWMKEGGSVR